MNTTEAMRQITDLAEKNGTRSNYYHTQALAVLRRLWGSGYAAGHAAGQDAAPPTISPEAIAEVARVGREWPDGVHTCAELQALEPGRRPCTCGRCPPRQEDGRPDKRDLEDWS